MGDADFDPQKSEPKGAANGTTNADAGVGERAHTLWLPLSFAKIVTARKFERLALSPPWISSQYRSWATRELRGNRREYLQWRWVGGVAALVCRKAITPDFDLFVRVFEGDFQHLVQQVAVTIQLIEGNSKKLKL